MLLAASVVLLSGGAHAQGNAECWSGPFTYEACCDTRIGPNGNQQCWDGPFDFNFCCTAAESGPAPAPPPTPPAPVPETDPAPAPPPTPPAPVPESAPLPIPAEPPKTLSTQNGQPAASKAEAVLGVWDEVSQFTMRLPHVVRSISKTENWSRVWDQASHSATHLRNVALSISETDKWSSNQVALVCVFIIWLLVAVIQVSVGPLVGTSASASTKSPGEDLSWSRARFHLMTFLVFINILKLCHLLERLEKLWVLVPGFVLHFVEPICISAYAFIDGAASRSGAHGPRNIVDQCVAPFLLGALGAQLAYNAAAGAYNVAPGLVEKIDTKWGMILAKRNLNGANGARAGAEAAYAAAVAQAKGVLESEMLARGEEPPEASVPATTQPPPEVVADTTMIPTDFPPEPTILPGQYLAYRPRVYMPRGEAGHPFLPGVAETVPRVGPGYQPKIYDKVKNNLRQPEGSQGQFPPAQLEWVITTTTPPPTTPPPTKAEVVMSVDMKSLDNQTAFEEDLKVKLAKVAGVDPSQIEVTGIEEAATTEPPSTGAAATPGQAPVGMFFQSTRQSVKASRKRSSNLVNRFHQFLTSIR